MLHQAGAFRCAWGDRMTSFADRLNRTNWTVALTYCSRAGRGRGWGCAGAERSPVVWRAEGRGHDADRRSSRTGCSSFRAPGTTMTASARFNEHSCVGVTGAAAGGSGAAANTLAGVEGHRRRRGRSCFPGAAHRERHSRAPAPSELSRRRAPMLFGLVCSMPSRCGSRRRAGAGPDKIIGRVGGTATQPGRFGWKARIPDLKTPRRRRLPRSWGSAISRASRTIRRSRSRRSPPLSDCSVRRPQSSRCRRSRQGR